MRALEQALGGTTKRIFLAAQKDPRIDDPLRDDICDTGVVATVIQNLKLPNGNVRVMVEGVQRGKILSVADTDGALNVEVETYEVSYPMGEELRTYMSKVLSAFEQYAKMSHHLAFEGLMSTLKLDDADRVADILSAHLMVATAEKQSLLELINPYERLQRLHDLLDVEIEKINIDKRINVKVKKQMEKAQKEYYLNEKIKAIHQELGRKDDRGDELTELREKIEKAGLPKEVKEKADQELKRLEAMPPVSAEATVSRNYIDWLVAVPWRKRSKERKDLDHAERVLNEDHYGLEKIKDRILEFLAVRQLIGQTKKLDHLLRRPSGRRQVVARQVDRAGHRAQVRPPVARRRARRGGDPRPPPDLHRRLPRPDRPDDAQGGDDQPDLPPGRGRQDVDGLPGRSVGGAAGGAGPGAERRLPRPLPRRRLRPLEGDVHRHRERDALDPGAAQGPHGGHQPLRLHAEREAGDRPAVPGAAGSSRTTACRRRRSPSTPRRSGWSSRATPARRACAAWSARSPPSAARSPAGWSRKGRRSRSRSPRRWSSSFLGKPKFRARRKNEESEIGVATGLAWTEVGGELLETEVGLMPGKGKLTLTGKLGDVMQESARAAVSYLRSRADLFGIEPDFNESLDVHLHVPEGAIPKDGPSAGITMATALISALTKIAVRKDVAMTGEITLRGKVLPVGGIKDKVLAAYRGGINEVILPRENEKDVEEIPNEVREAMEFHLVESMDEVLRLALNGTIVPLPKKDGKFTDTAPDSPVGSDSLAH